MGNSPSRSASVENVLGGGMQTLECSDGAQQPPFNPFDVQEGGSHTRDNFPMFSDAMVQGCPDFGPSIDTLASLYPIDFPVR